MSIPHSSQDLSQSQQRIKPISFKIQLPESETKEQELPSIQTNPERTWEIPLGGEFSALDPDAEAQAILDGTKDLETLHPSLQPSLPFFRSATDALRNIDASALRTAENDFHVFLRRITTAALEDAFSLRMEDAQVNEELDKVASTIKHELNSIPAQEKQTITMNLDQLLDESAIPSSSSSSTVITHIAPNVTITQLEQYSPYRMSALYSGEEPTYPS